MTRCCGTAARVTSARHLGRGRRPDLRPDAALGPDQPTVHRSRQRGPGPQTGRCRQDTPRHGARTHRDPPPSLGPSRPRRQAVHPTARCPSGQHPGRQSPQTRPRRRPHSRRLRAAAAQPDRDHEIYELIVERRREARTVVTFNREPAEWLAMMSDALLAQSTVDKLTQAPTSWSSKAPPTGSAVLTARRHSRPRRGPVLIT